MNDTFGTSLLVYTKAFDKNIFGYKKRQKILFKKAKKYIILKKINFKKNIGRNAME